MVASPELQILYTGRPCEVSLVMSECSLSGLGQSHVSNFYVVDLENFTTANRRYTGDIHNSSVVGLFMTPIKQWKRLDMAAVCHVGVLKFNFNGLLG